MEADIQRVHEVTTLQLVEREPSKLIKLWGAFCQKKAALIALIVLMIIVLACILAPVVSPYSPYAGNLKDRLLPIGSAGHLLGTDEQGRDLFARILYGGRISLISGIVPVMLAVLIGGGLGIIAGYWGKFINVIIMRTLDIMYSFPAILLAIGISAVLGSGISNIMISATIVFIPPIARMTESAVLEVRKEEYIEAARSSGAGTLMLIRYHVLPNIFSKIFVFSTTQIGICLLFASSLSFLGLGVSPPTPEWGFMLNNLKQLIFIDPILTVVPGVFIFLTSLSLNMVSDALSDVMEMKE